MQVELKDILIAARQESHRMQHYYIGVEHLFIALLDIRGGLMRSILEERGMTPDYIIDAVRQKVGKGSKRRLWAGTPSTPRTSAVLSLANVTALKEGRNEVNECDLLTAILREGESIPVRVLRRLGLDTEEMIALARTSRPWQSVTQNYVEIEINPNMSYGLALTEEQRLILRRMFYGYARIRVESSLTGGYSGALLLVVTPMHTDGRVDAAVVVKIAEADDILDEATRYDTHIKNTLPPLTARIEDKPVAPDVCTQAGIKYTLVAQQDKPPQDLRTAAADMSPAQLATWLHQQLYAQFGRTWWQQHRTFNFLGWTEYDWLLPPILTIQRVPDRDIPANTPVLHAPFNRGKLKDIEYGETVVLENFIVQRLYPKEHALQLSIGRGNEATRRAFKVRVSNVDFEESFHYRGEVIERLVGRVWETRDDTLYHAALKLEPQFSLKGDKLHIPALPGPPLFNPLQAYEDLLYFHVEGATSKIHGDLHLGNILVGPYDSAFLIDFAHSRDGHTAFDWAMLEISLLSERIMPLVSGDWDAVYEVLLYVEALNKRTEFPTFNHELEVAFVPLRTLRAIAQRCLNDEHNWMEYHVALVFCALRALTWETMNLGARRLMLLLAALSVEACHQPAAHHQRFPKPDQLDDTEF
ncbi:MAG: phosphotransferase [Anaerolineae bacterium]|nr:phosphotransferase [Anaerolineae bacterium]